MFRPMHADTLEETPPDNTDGAAAPMHARTGVSEVARTTRTIPTARVNLMPPEVFIGRRVKRIKRRIVIALALVLVGSAAGTGWFKVDAGRATAASRPSRRR